MDKEYFDALMESLADAVAFSKGDISRARVIEADAAVYQASGAVQEPSDFSSDCQAEHTFSTSASTLIPT